MNLFGKVSKYVDSMYIASFSQAHVPTSYLLSSPKITIMK